MVYSNVPHRLMRWRHSGTDGAGVGPEWLSGRFRSWVMDAQPSADLCGRAVLRGGTTKKEDHPHTDGRLRVYNTRPPLHLVTGSNFDSGRVGGPTEGGLID